MSDWAVIFDVDGVLLELTPAEEELFFAPFAKWMDASKLSRDWNSYAIRNDEDIVKEIIARNELGGHKFDEIVYEYITMLEVALNSNLRSMPVPGAKELLAAFAPHARLSIATANFRRAAELRLAQVGMWDHVSDLAFGADGGGHKSDILARANAALGLPPDKVIFIGDNVNDVLAGKRNLNRFIGFSTDPERLKALKAAGAETTSSNHAQTINIVRSMLAR